MKARLLTRDGLYVATVTTLPYQIIPEVLIWGMRMFARRDDGSSGDWYEVFVACALPDEVTK